MNGYSSRNGYVSRMMLLAVFNEIMDHYSFGIDNRREAWAVALQHPHRAWVCYSAILRSL